MATVTRILITLVMAIAQDILAIMATVIVVLITDVMVVINFL